MAGAVADHGDVNERLMMARVALVIAHQASCLDQPAEGAFHDPAFGQYDEALG